MNLEHNNIGADYVHDCANPKYVNTLEGVKSIADALRVNTSMIRANLIQNRISGAGGDVLRKAVEGRSGFELRTF